MNDILSSGQRKLILIRGLPGSGKTTIAQLIGNQWEGDWDYDTKMFSTDDFFMVNGEYKFDPSKLKEYHEANISRVEHEMKEMEMNVIVHNTFTQEWEMEPYYELAKKYKWAVISLIVENRHEGKSIHGVPDNTIEHMRNRFDIKL